MIDELLQNARVSGNGRKYFTSDKKSGSMTDGIFL